MQWTAGGFVPANGTVPNAGEVKGGFVAPSAYDVEPDEVIVTRVLRKPAPKPAPKNVVALAKARLREVKTELRRLKALEKEKGELERLIAAAENKSPKSNLREIKRSAG
jgi:hypothetical protein